MKTSAEIKRAVGRRGEELAQAWLRRRGYEIIATSYHFGRREIDIIAREQNELVFVEVKCNTSLAFGQPEERVNSRKQAHLISIAQHFLEEHGGETADARFDVIAVLLEPGGGLRQINHIKHAFGVPSPAV